MRVIPATASIHGEPPAVLHGHGFSTSGYELAHFLALPDVGYRRSRGRLHGLALWLLKKAPSPASCIVFASAPATARAVFERLHRMADDGTAEMLLLTGRVRERDVEHMRKRILDPVHGMAASRDPASRGKRHLIVVATDMLEVGGAVHAGYRLILGSIAISPRAELGGLFAFDDFRNIDEARLKEFGRGLDWDVGVDLAITF